MKKTLFNTALLLVLLYSNANANNKDIVLIDNSGSMNNELITKPIRTIYKAYLGKKYISYKFDKNITEFSNEKELTFDGSTTNLKRALEFLNKNHQNSFIILFTDAKVSDDEEVLKLSKAMKNRGLNICSIYVGDSNQKIPALLKKISFYSFISVNFQKAIKFCTKQKDLYLKVLSAKKLQNDVDRFNIFKRD